MREAKNSRKGVLRLLRSFVRDRRGVSAIEFAFVFPVMAALYLGGTALTQGIVIKRKVTLATRTVGDLTSQDTDISDDEMNAIFIAAGAVMEPYAPNPMTLTITNLNVDDKGVAKVLWSDKSVNGGQRQAGRNVGDIVTLPDGVNTKGTVIMAEGLYTYTPAWGTDFVGTLPFTETFYLRPRRVTCILRKSGSCPTS